MPGSTYQVEVLDSFEDAEKYRAFWSANVRDPESDPDFCAFIIKSRPEIIRPHIVVVTKDGQPVVIVAGRIEDAHLDLKIGYKVVTRIKVRRLAVFYDGFMGDVESEAGAEAVRGLVRCLRSQKADLLVWSGVKCGSKLHSLLKRVPGILSRDYVSPSLLHHGMTLPSSLEELLEKRMNKKHRYWARRTMRQLEKDFPGGTRLECFSKPGEMEKIFQDVIQVARKTYQWGLGVGFRDSVEQKARLKLELERGWSRVFVLYVKNVPVAFWICIVYGDKVYSAYTGYDPDYRKYEVGTALFLRMVGEMCREKFKQLDFGLGSALYKERFGDIVFEENTLCIFAAGIRGAVLNFLRIAGEGPILMVRAVLKRYGLEQKLKKAWRSRAIAESPGNAGEATVNQPVPFTTET